MATADRLVIWALRRVLVVQVQPLECRAPVAQLALAVQALKMQMALRARTERMRLETRAESAMAHAVVAAQMLAMITAARAVLTVAVLAQAAVSMRRKDGPLQQAARIPAQAVAARAAPAEAIGPVDWLVLVAAAW